MLGFKITELVKYLAELEQHKKMYADCKADFDKLDGQIKDYDSLLKE